MFRATEEIRGTAIRIALEGGDPREYLKEQGSKAPDTAWGNIKKDLKKIAPDVWNQLPKRIGQKPQPMKVKLDQLAEPEKIGPEPPKPGTVPLQYNGFTVCSIEGKFGKYEYSKKHNMLYFSTDQGDEIALSPEDWLRFASGELLDVMGILGAMPTDKKEAGAAGTASDQ